MKPAPMKPLLRVVARLAVGALLAAGPIVIGCHEDDFGFASSGGFGGSSGSTRGFVDAASPAEPCDKAKTNVTCSLSSAKKCEIGTSANPRCNTRFTCNFQWDEDEDDHRLACPGADACPAEYTHSAADRCAQPDAISLICEYEQGTCGCAPVGGVTTCPNQGDDDDDDDDDAGVDAGVDDADAGDADAPDADMPDADADAPDAAATDAGPRTYEWKCVTPAPGCPHTRPREGLRCVRPITCDYGYGVFEDGVVMSCNNGFWVRNPERRGERCDQ